MVGWFQGRMEFGPRALGARHPGGCRAIPEMRDTLNVKMKYREGFRPFAAAVLGERVAEWFELGRARAPTCCWWPPVRGEARVIPSVTHVDGSARMQTVDAGARTRCTTT